MWHVEQLALDKLCGAHYAGYMTYYWRKARLWHGASREVAKASGVDESLVSRVLRGTFRDRRIEEMLADRMLDPHTEQPVTVTEAFGPPGTRGAFVPGYGS